MAAAAAATVASSTPKLLRSTAAAAAAFKDLAAPARFTSQTLRAASKQPEGRHPIPLPLPRAIKKHLRSARLADMNRKVPHLSHSFARLRCSTLSGAHISQFSQTELLNFIKSSVYEIEGPNHCWLNNMRKSFSQDDCFLVLVNAYCKDSKLLDHRDCIGALERVKWVQQRYPKLNVFGLQCGVSVTSVAAITQIIQTVMEEFITFPILISDKDFLKLIHGPCYLFFDGCSNHLVYHKLDIDLEVIIEVIEEFNESRKDNTMLLQNPISVRTVEHRIVVEPSICSSLRNLLLYYPGCVSVDEKGKRLFVSDSNHHRIIITDVDGKILDCIGSSSGFEDGEFESAKLQRPAASFYDVTEDLLYIVDSENHAIRRADMERRVLETVYPVPVQNSSGLWSLLLDKLGMAREIEEKVDGELDPLSFPWHLIKLGEMDFLILNRSFGTSWVVEVTTGKIKEILKGTTSILEVYGHMIKDRVSLLEDIHGCLSRQMHDRSFPLGSIMHADLISSVASLDNETVLCNPGAQRILKFDRESRSTSYIQFTDLAVLGLPYWFICPPERVFDRGHLERLRHEQLHCLDVEPGQCKIRVNVDILMGAELAAPLVETCIWRQARGVAAEVFGQTKPAEAGIAQKYIDELDKLVFEDSESESDDPQDGEQSIHTNFWDKDKAHFNCIVDLSPGTSELVVSAVLYLQLKRTEDCREEQARKILGLQTRQNEEPGDDACIHILKETSGDIHDIIFMKPLHLRIRLACADHPPGMTTHETLIVKSRKEINVSLD